MVNRTLERILLLALPAALLLVVGALEMPGIRPNDEIWTELDRSTDTGERVILAASLVLRGELDGWTDERRRGFLDRFDDMERRRLCTLFPLELGRAAR